MDLSFIILAAAVVAAVYVFIRLISAPLRLMLKLVLHAVSGFLILLVVEIISGFFDFSLGINLINCLVAGVFGIPGVILLIAIKLFL